jgi:hypothetical protein
MPRLLARQLVLLTMTLPPKTLPRLDPSLRRPPRPKDGGHGPDSAHAMFKPFLFPFYLNKFQELFQTLKFMRN